MVVPLLLGIGIALPRDCWQAWRLDFVNMLKQHLEPDTPYGEMVFDLSDRCLIEVQKKGN